MIEKAQTKAKNLNLTPQSIWNNSKTNNDEIIDVRERLLRTKNDEATINPPPINVKNLFLFSFK